MSLGGLHQPWHSGAYALSALIESPVSHYIEKIQECDTLPELLKFWRTVRDGSSPRGWRLGQAFEHLILRAFQLDGLDVHWPYEVPFFDRPGEQTVEQVDGLVWLEAVCFMIEAKNVNRNVDFTPIAKLRSRLARRPSAIVGLLFSRNGFTEPAKTMARFLAPQTVLLWEGSELDYALTSPGLMKEGLRNKYRAAHMYAIPDFHIRAATLTL